MVYVNSGAGTYVDAESGLTVRNQGGGPGGLSSWEIVGDGWSIHFTFTILPPSDGGAIKLTLLLVGKTYPGTRDEARVLVREFMDTWRRMPFRMKGRTEPREILI